MVVRIRFGRGPKVGKQRGKNQRAALAVGALLDPAALMALALGVWRITADLKWSWAFAISNGFFSHWQVWIAAAILLWLCSRALNHYGKSGAKDPSRATGLAAAGSAAARRT